MILVTFVIGILTSITQFMRYKGTPKDRFLRPLMTPTIITLVISVLLTVFGGIDYDKYGTGFLVAIHMTLWTGVYAVVANGSYMWKVMRSNLKAAGASVGHIGFGLMVVGILISSANKELISRNRTGIAIPGLKDAKGRDENPLENVTLLHNIPTPMGEYMVTYLGDSSGKNNDKVYFKIQFEQRDSSGLVKSSFTVTPNAFLMKGEEGTQLSSNPGARHYINRDVFVYITSWLNPDNIQDTTTFRLKPARESDTMFYSNGFIVLERMLSANRNDNKDLPVVDSAWLTQLRVYAKDGRQFTAEPAFLVKDGAPALKLDTIMEQSLILKLDRSRDGEIQLGVRESAAVTRYITLKAFEFPWINLLWLGTIVMVIGFMMSAIHRARMRIRAV
jgi:cytochrome c-type biogenesis protein CcmF